MVDVSEETIFHLVMSHSFDHEVWKELDRLTGHMDIWARNTIEEGLKKLV
jgi:hypothetical protein